MRLQLSNNVQRALSDQLRSSSPATFHLLSAEAVDNSSTAVELFLR
jgi:hypothetical protein